MFTKIYMLFWRIKKWDYFTTSWQKYNFLYCTSRIYVRWSCGNFSTVKMEPRHQSKDDPFQYPVFRDCNSPYNWRSDSPSFWVSNPLVGLITKLKLVCSVLLAVIRRASSLTGMRVSLLSEVSHRLCRMSWRTYIQVHMYRLRLRYTQCLVVFTIHSAWITALCDSSRQHINKFRFA